MNKKRLIIAAIAVVLLIVVYSFYNQGDDENISITAKVKQGEFLNEVYISGEAQSTSSKKINGPSSARRFGLYQLKVQDLVPEGTIVKKGDLIGKLDVSAVNEKILDAMVPAIMEIIYKIITTSMENIQANPFAHNDNDKADPSILF